MPRSHWTCAVEAIDTFGSDQRQCKRPIVEIVEAFEDTAVLMASAIRVFTPS